MPLTVQGSGTQTAVIGTEHSLGGPFTTAGVYTAMVNLENMVAGDQVSLRAYVQVLSGDVTKKLLYSAEYANDQGDAADVGAEAGGDVVVISIPIPSPYEIEFTLTQEAGTGRNFPWRVDTL